MDKAFLKYLFYQQFELELYINKMVETRQGPWAAETADQEIARHDAIYEQKIAQQRQLEQIIFNYFDAHNR
jgi:hypothetical protein